MRSILFALLASLPLVLVPPGVCPYRALGLECDAADQDHEDGDCHCPQIKDLSAPHAPVDHGPDNGPALDVAPAEVVSLSVFVSPSASDFRRFDVPADPPIYLMLRAFLC